MLPYYFIWQGERVVSDRSQMKLFFKAIDGKGVCLRICTTNNIYLKTLKKFVRVFRRAQFEIVMIAMKTKNKMRGIIKTLKLKHLYRLYKITFFFLYPPFPRYQKYSLVPTPCSPMVTSSHVSVRPW